MNQDPARADDKDPLDRKRLARLLQKSPEEPAGFVLPLQLRGTAGAAAAGRCGADSCSCCRGIRRWGTGCRSTACRGKRRRTATGSRRATPSTIVEPLPVMPPGAVHEEEAPGEAQEKPLDTLDPHRPLRRATRGQICTSFCRRSASWSTSSNSSMRSRRPPRSSGWPVLLEGYEPPRDPRLQMFRSRPTRGHRGEHPPGARLARAGRQHHARCTRQARQARLATEKFMLDGRHTGTGGGNHVTLGGATPADSPLLRRPRPAAPPDHLLAQPSGAVLSVLRRCSSARPARRRVSTRRATTISTSWRSPSSRCPDGDGSTAPWLVDRVLRNLLVDLTGNTHRAEFCIDKLYSPDGPAGGSGLLEFRAFEMPPHWQHERRADAAAARPDRAVLAASPTSGRLIRWGTELHDRFMLPHFVAEDMRDVVRRAAARRAFAFEHAWFEPLLRVPLSRATARSPSRACELELRWRHRALARAGRGSRRRGGTVALCRFVGGTPAGEGQRHG